jgi:hypothetical protein
MATAAGESPTTTNGFCSPAFDRAGIEQHVAIALTATRLRMTGGIDIMLPHRKSGQSFPTYGYLIWRVLEGGSSLLLPHTTSTCSGFHLKTVDGDSPGRARLPNNLKHFPKLLRVAIDAVKLGTYSRRAVDMRITTARRGYLTSEICSPIINQSR